MILDFVGAMGLMAGMITGIAWWVIARELGKERH